GIVVGTATPIVFETPATTTPTSSGGGGSSSPPSTPSSAATPTNASTSSGLGPGPQTTVASDSLVRSPSPIPTNLLPTTLPRTGNNPVAASALLAVGLVVLGLLVNALIRRHDPP